MTLLDKMIRNAAIGAALGPAMGPVKAVQGFRKWVKKKEDEAFGGPNQWTFTKSSPLNAALQASPTPIATATQPPATETPPPVTETPVPRYPFESEIREYGKKYGIAPRMIDAIVSTETESYNPKAYRFEPSVYQSLLAKGYDEPRAKEEAASYGLAQTMGTTARSLGLSGGMDQLYTPTTSLDYLGKYYEDQFKRYNDVDWTVPETFYKAYNGGNPYAKINEDNLKRFLKNYEKSKEKYKD